MLRSAASVAAIALVTAGGASAEVVARGVQDGLLALDAKGTPSVAWVHNSTLFVATRPGPHRGRGRRRPRSRRARARWPSRSAPPGRLRSSRAATTARSSSSARARSAGRRSGSPRSARSSGSAGRVSRSTAAGQPTVSYTRWNAPTLKSRLLVSRVDAKGRISTRRITQEGFPKSLVPPPSAPVLFGDVAHVVESYGYRGVLGTIEWFPSKKTWIGLGLDAGIGDYPVGPVFAGLSANGIMHAAWTESLLSFDIEAAPVTLVERRRFASSAFVLDRALTSALVLPSTGPEVAANQWIGQTTWV